MNRIVFCILYVLSRSPLIAITLDKQFHNISKNNFSFSDLRFSLLSFGLGIKKIYIFSWKKGEKFKIIKILSLNEVNKLPNGNEINEKTNNYHEHIDNLTGDDIKLEIDFLKYKIDQDESTKQLAYTKMNNYTAVILVVIPLIITSFTSGFDKLNIMLKALFGCILIYNLLNIVIYLIDFYKVKGFNRSTFNGIKQSDKHLNKLAESYYEDWYSIKEEAPFFVTYVTDVERYLKYCILALFIIFGMNALSASSGINSKRTIINRGQTKDSVYYIKLKNDGQVNNQYTRKLVDLYSCIEKENIKQIIILKGFPNNKSFNKQYELILNSVKMFNSNNASIKEINDVLDDSNSGNYIKIIMEGNK